VNTFHVIALVPPSWKAVVVLGSFTSREFAKIWFKAPDVHCMHIMLVSKEAGPRTGAKEAGTVCGRMLTGEGVEVRVLILPGLWLGTT